MSRRRRLLLALSAALVLAPLLVWNIALPAGLFERMLEQETDTGLRARAEGLRKEFLFGLRAERISIIDEAGVPLADISNARCRLKLSSLLLLRADIPFYADIAGGKIAGDLLVKPSGYKMEADITGARAGEIPVLKGLFTGSISGRLSLNDGSGAFIFRVSDLGGLPVGFESAKGIAGISDGSVNLKSVTLEGENIYGRVKGTIRNGTYELTAEVMPEKEVLENSPVLKTLSKYEVSTGHFVIALSGRLRAGP